ncbi:PspA/IM30 family protein [Serratia fonticola]
MAMSILRRLLRILKANANDAVDQMEDPALLARQMVRDFEVQIGSTEEVVAAVIGQQNLLQKQLEASKKAVSDWNDRAHRAVQAARDDLARTALQYVQRYERNVAFYSNALETLNPKVEDLKSKLATLRDEYEDAKNEVTLLDARAKIADTSGKVSRIMGGVGNNAIDMTKIRSKVDKLEADSAALDSMAKEVSGQDLKKQFDMLGTPHIDQRLEELKKQTSSGGSDVQ